jgi:hypothetical protein
MSEWKNEDDIKAELRVLTDELRRLREGLRNMVGRPVKPNPSRAFLHRESWPAARVGPVSAAGDHKGPRRNKR